MHTISLTLTDPLYQTSTYPGVTFYDEPQEREFPSTGGHAVFSNGVEVTVPPEAVPPGLTVGVKVQPGFAPSDVFVMPEGIQSASPSYLISSDRSDGLNGEATVTMEHHVRVSTREEADDLCFLQADPTPDERSVYKYSEVSEGRSEFNPERSLSVTGPPTEKSALVDVAHNNTRGSSQRLREKREKIRQATHRPSSDSKGESEKCVQSFVSDASRIKYLIDICGLYIPNLNNYCGTIDCCVAN